MGHYLSKLITLDATRNAGRAADAYGRAIYYGAYRKAGAYTIGPLPEPHRPPMPTPPQPPQPPSDFPFNGG